MLFPGIVYAAEVAEEAAQVVAVVSVGAALDQLVGAVLVALVPVVGVIGAYLVVLVRSYLKSKIAKIKSDEVRAAADYAMTRLDRIVTNIVKEIQQTKPTGESVTPEQSKDLLKKAYARVKAQVTDDIMEIVKTAVKDSDRYIVTKIEAAVAETKAK